MQMHFSLIDLYLYFDLCNLKKHLKCYHKSVQGHLWNISNDINEKSQ